jgi:PPP family 3-phenylpropionic acid transporter
MSDERAANGAGLIAFYMLYFASVGITLTYLPAYLKSLGFSGAQVGLLLSLGPMLMLVAPPFWGQRADRLGRADRVLAAVTAGAVLSFAPLLWARGYVTVALCLACYAFFQSSITTLADSLAIQRVAQVGGAFAHLRLFGSLGFVLSAAAFGRLAPSADERVVWAALGCMVAYAAVSAGLHARSTPSVSRGPVRARTLLADRGLALFLIATALHWIASAPYHGSFAIHVTALGLPPSVIGWSASLGVLAEVGVMYAQPKLTRHVSVRAWFVLSLLAGVVRWVGMAFATRPWEIIALSTLHGLTFGAFYVSAVGFLVEKVPAALRASGQALFVSITFGVGGIVGFSASGWAYDVLGGARLFGAAAALDLVTALGVLALGIGKLGGPKSAAVPNG